MQRKELNSVTAYKRTQILIELLVDRVKSNFVGAPKILLPLCKTFGY